MAQASIPQWEVSDLLNLQSSGRLSGVPAWALAGMAENESGGEIKGAGVNPQGYGGYFGESTSVIGPSDLGTASESEFLYQAQVVAHQLAGYGSPQGTLGNVAIFNIGGAGSNQGQNWQASQDALDAAALSSGTLSGVATVGLSQSGGPGSPPKNYSAGVPASGSSGSSGSSTIAGRGSFGTGTATGSANLTSSPTTSTAAASSGFGQKLLPWLFMLGGVALILVGLVITFKGSQTVQSAEKVAPLAAA